MQGLSANTHLTKMFYGHYYLNIELFYFYAYKVSSFNGYTVLEPRLKTYVKTSSKLSESEQESCTSIFRNAMRLRQKLNTTASEVAKTHGLQISEMSLIDTLGKYGSLPMGELAALSFSSPANASYTVRSLEQRELLNRKRSMDSQRVVDVHLTPKGEKVFKHTYPQTTDAVNDLINTRLTKQERLTLDNLLNKLAD
jgi:DNA-binding MarR family transcriptional regulator